MSTWQANYWAGLKAILAATWPEMTGVPAVTRRDVAMESVNWANKLKSGELKAPWCVVLVEYEPTDQYAANIPCYFATATIWYVVKILGEITSTTAMTTIEAKLEALRESLVDEQSLPNTEMQAPIDTTANNPMNLTMLEQQVPFQAGSATFKTLVAAGSS